MIHVDVFGGYVICGAGSIVGAGMMKLARPGEPHVRQGLTLCFWAFLAIGLGLFQFVFTSDDPPRWSILCGVEGAACGTALFGFGFARLAGVRISRFALVCTLAALGVALPVLQQVTGPTEFATIFDITCLIISAWIVKIQLRYLYAPANRAQFFLSLAIAIYMVTWVFRLAASAVSPGPVIAHMLYLPEPFSTGYAIFYGTIPIIIGALVLNMVNEHLNERLATHALTDDLTGLKTRRALRNIERGGFLAADRSANDVAVLIVDVDHFKNVNDRHGHATGDKVLVHMARTVESAVRAEALVTRFGGEEFVVVVPVSDLRVARLVAERLRSAIESTPFADADVRLALTVSIGLAVWLERESLEVALRRADGALYNAKASGRNLVMVTPELVA